MTKGKTTLIQNGKSNRNEASSLMPHCISPFGMETVDRDHWEIYDFLENKGILAEE